MAIFNERTMEIEPNAGESQIINIPKYNGIKNESKFINWLCRKKGILLDDHDCHLSPEDGCDCQKYE